MVGGRGDDHGPLSRRGALTILRRRAAPTPLDAAITPPRTAVVIPTRDRPASLRRCLEALAAARERTPFETWVCDSSDHARRDEIAAICEPYPWVRLRFHDGRTIARARNFCVEVAEAELLVSVDDDVRVAPQAVEALLAAYDWRTGPTVVAGAVVWGHQPIPPMVLRPIGYGRAARAGEAPDFLNSSLFLYPRAYGRQWPWNERMRRGSDVLMGAIWRRAGVAMAWAPDARAEHEEDRDVLTAERHGDYVYALLAHALIASRSPSRLVLIETVTLAAGLRGYVRSLDGLREYLSAWIRGHVAFVRDYRALRALAARPVPGA